MTIARKEEKSDRSSSIGLSKVGPRHHKTFILPKTDGSPTSNSRLRAKRKSCSNQSTPTFWPNPNSKMKSIVPWIHTENTPTIATRFVMTISYCKLGVALRALIEKSHQRESQNKKNQREVLQMRRKSTSQSQSLY